MTATCPQPPLVDLRPPALLREANFPLSRKPWKELQRHAESGSLLPTEPEEYQGLLLLESADLNQFKSEISGLLMTYGDIQRRCMNFKEHTFPATVDLACLLYNYSTDARSYYGVFYQPQESITDDVDMQNTVSAIREEIYLQTSAMYSKAGTIIVDLMKFEDEIQTFKGNTEEAIANLEEKTKGRVTELNTKVDFLKQSVADQDKNLEETAQKYWIPLIGWVSQSVLLAEPGKSAAKFIYNHLLQAKKIELVNDDQNALDIMKFHGETVVYELDDILQSIQPAITIMQSMQDSFSEISQSVDELTDQAERINADHVVLPNLGLEVTLDVVQEQWKILAGRGKLLSIQFTLLY
jgi:hypothetical protein